MGIRMDQHMGLTNIARKLIKGEDIQVAVDHVVREFPDGRKEHRSDRPVLQSTIKCEPSGHHVGMFEDEFDLHKYTLLDGTVFQEYVQASPWSSGPCFFLALQNADGEPIEETLWSESEIDNA